MSTIAPPPESTETTVTVRTAAPHEARAVARTIAAAFYDDPVSVWFYPRPETRLGQLADGFERMTVGPSLAQGAVHVAGDGAGAAVCVPPGGHPTTWESVRMLPAVARATGRTFGRVMRGVAAMDASVPREPHWYLGQIAVRAELQGRGIGSALLQRVLDLSDADGVPAYLEATTPRSRALYARHGFEVVEAFRLPGGGPPLWGMRREPRAPAGLR